MITMRRATAADARDVFDWRNDPQSRWASVSQHPIDWDAHVSWFERSISSPARRLYIAEEADADDDVSVGMVRFDLHEGDHAADVSINLNPRWRGRGVSGATLTAGLAALRDERGALPPLLATIRPQNAASVRLFERNGFVETSRDADFVYYRRDAERA